MPAPYESRPGATSSQRAPLHFSHKFLRKTYLNFRPSKILQHSADAECWQLQFIAMFVMACRVWAWTLNICRVYAVLEVRSLGHCYDCFPLAAFQCIVHVLLALRRYFGVGFPKAWVHVCLMVGKLRHWFLYPGALLQPLQTSRCSHVRFRMPSAKQDSQH